MARASLGIYGIRDRVSAPYPVHVHDHSLCRIEEGMITHYVHLERLSRRKYDNRLDEFLETWIRQGLVPWDENTDVISANSHIGSAFLSKNGRLRLETAPPQKIISELYPAQAWYQARHWEGYPMQAWGISHELAHVASTLPFYGDWEENSLHVHLDGAASLSNFSAFTFRSGRLQVVEADWELHPYTSLFNVNPLSRAILGAEKGGHNSLAGKLMGLAAWGQDRPGLDEWLRRHAFFAEQTIDEFKRVARRDLGWKGEIHDTHDPLVQSLAFAFQKAFRNALMARLARLQEKETCGVLYFTGGGALNIGTNRAIIRSGLFEDLKIPPACPDSGLSIGAAAFMEWKKYGRVKRHSPYLNNVGLGSFLHQSYVPEQIALLAQYLHERQIWGVCLGAAEAGPRALGNRSILARADHPDLARRLSQECKRREWFRPIAPVMLAKNLPRVSHQGQVPDIARYMLVDFSIHAGGEKILAGAVHQDGTSRIQIIKEREDHPFLYDLLVCLEEKYSILALLNTSFNQSGEPLVHSPADARKSAEAMGLDGVVLGNQMVYGPDYGLDLLN